MFARFVGTMGPSDFPSAYMSDVRPVAFSDRSPLWGSRWDLPVLASGVSMHAQVLRLRRVFRRLAILRCLPCCLPHSRTRSARGTMQISELNGWPACSPCPCHTQDVTVLSVGFGAEWLARPFSYDSFIRYSRPVYPGAFPAPAPAPGLRVPSTLAGRVGNGDLALFAEPGTKRIGRKRQGSRWAAFCSAPLVTSRLRSRQAGRS